MEINKDIFQSREALTFDDVLVVPAYSEILPSETDVTAYLTPDIRLQIPLLSAAMDTVTEARMAIALAREGGLGILHRNLSPQHQAAEVDKVKRSHSGMDKDSQQVPTYPNSTRDSRGRLLVGAALGVGEDLEERAGLLVEADVDAVVIDTAHGHSKGVIQAIQRVHRQWPKLPVIAGNVVTAQGTKALIEAGVSAVKVGVGAGSICTTRIIAGVGMPQLTAIYVCAQMARKSKIPIIADGGIKYSGDIVKAIVAGADTVMLGSLFSGLDESPGEDILFEGRHFKYYRGMGSLAALQGFGKDRYAGCQTSESSRSDDPSNGNLAGAGKLVPEGIEGRVPCKGTLHDFVYQLVGGLRAGMGYAGVQSLDGLRTKTRLVRITHAGLIESHPHNVIISSEAPNYYLPQD